MSIPDDILQRWEAAVQHYWDETSGQCSECLQEFQTGDVVIVFGELDNAAAKKFYLCARHGYQAIVTGNIPSATSVFISDVDRGKKLSWLGEETVARISEAFAIVDRIHNHMAELVALAGGMTGKDPSEDAPS